MLAIRPFEFTSFQSAIDSLNHVLPALNSQWHWHSFSPSTDICENQNEYLLEIDLPGLTEKDIQVSLENRHLTIKGSRVVLDKEGYTRRERGFGEFERIFHLPEDVDTSRIEAKANHGVLTLRLPKTEAAKPKTIAVVSG